MPGDFPRDGVRKGQKPIEIGDQEYENSKKAVGEWVEIYESAQEIAEDLGAHQGKVERLLYEEGLDPNLEDMDDELVPDGGYVEREDDSVNEESGYEFQPPEGRSVRTDGEKGDWLNGGSDW
jgi:hypothetical protein